MLQINIFFVFLDHFYVLMWKINLKNKKNIILIYFLIKNILKNKPQLHYKYETSNNTFLYIYIYIHTNGANFTICFSETTFQELEMDDRRNCH